MNYFLFHIGSPYPSHLEYCIRQIIKKDNDSKIYLCGDRLYKGDTRVNFLDVNDLNIFFENTYFTRDPDPLWRTSLMRIFAINSFLQKTNLEGIIHFDNDVMIYDDFKKISHNLERKNYITPHKNTEYTFGFSYINNKEHFNILSEKIKEQILLGEEKVKKMTGDHAHEMRLLNYCGEGFLFPLPVHPSINSISNYIFDPSSYGQYLGGTPAGHKPGFIDKTQLVGGIFETYHPIIEYNKEQEMYILTYREEKYKIFNLHVHNKNLNNFYHE